MDRRTLADAAGPSGGVGATAGGQGHAEQREKPSASQRDSGGAREAVELETPGKPLKTRGRRRGPSERGSGGMPVERRDPRGRNSSDIMGGRGEMSKAPIRLHDLRRRIYTQAQAAPSWCVWGTARDACTETTGRWLEEVEEAVAVSSLGIVQGLPGAATTACAESAPSVKGPIPLETKRAGKRSAGNPHTAFDAAGAGNVTMGAL